MENIQRIYMNKPTNVTVRDTFDVVADGYDNPALRFFTESAKHLPKYLPLKGDEHVLDVATGTGHAAIALASALPRGQVTGIDFSEGMLARAKAKIEARGIRNVRLLPMDMQALDFPDNAFDAAVLSFSLFFVEDMEAALRHVMSKVIPSGKIIVTSFNESSFSPLVEIFFERVKKYGVEVPAGWRRLSTTGECMSLFEKTGLIKNRVDMKRVGYYLENPSQWWNVVWNGGLRRYVEQLSSSDMEKFKAEHLNEIGELATDDGVWLEIEVLYTSGVKQP